MQRFNKKKEILIAIGILLTFSTAFYNIFNSNLIDKENVLNEKDNHNKNHPKSAGYWVLA